MLILCQNLCQVLKIQRIIRNRACSQGAYNFVGMEQALEIKMIMIDRKINNYNRMYKVPQNCIQQAIGMGRINNSVPGIWKYLGNLHYNKNIGNSSFALSMCEVLY